MPVPAWLLPAAIAGSSALSFLGADKAADAQKDAANASIGEQRRQFDTVLGLQQPAIQTGNAARSLLASLLGLDVGPIRSPYLTGGASGYGGGGGSSMSAFGKVANLATLGSSGMLGFGRHTKSTNRPLADRDAQALVDQVRANPEAYDTPAELQTFIMSQRPGARAQIDNLLRGGELSIYAPTPSPGPMSGEDIMARLEALPGFKFSVDQARKSATAQASATGSSPVSGNVLTALTNNVSGNIAMPVFQDYLNRLASLSGAAQTASTNVGGAALDTGRAVGGLMQDLGDARASGIAGKTNSIIDLLSAYGTMAGRNAAGSGVDYIVPGVNAPAIPGYR